MNGRLPIEIESLELPKNDDNKDDKIRVNGFVSIIYLVSLLISLGSIFAIMIMGNR